MSDALTGRVRPRISLTRKVILQVEEEYMVHVGFGEFLSATRWRDARPEDLQIVGIGVDKGVG